MARDLEYDISLEAYAVFKSYIELRMKLPYFSNACTFRNAMDRVRMNTVIRTFKALFRVLMEIFVMLRISIVFVLMTSRLLWMILSMLIIPSVSLLKFR